MYLSNFMNRETGRDKDLSIFQKIIKSLSQTKTSTFDNQDFREKIMYHKRMGTNPRILKFYTIGFLNIRQIVLTDLTLYD